MRSWFVVVASVGAVTAVAASAGAAPDDVIARPLVLDRNQVAADVTLEYNLAPESPGNPLSLAPDLWWGVSPRLTLGVIHSDRSLDQIQPGASFCLHSGDIDGLCDRAYRGGGIDARWSWFDDGTFAVAPRARFLIRDLDPWKPAITIGGLARWHRGRFAITTDPYLLIGVANTEDGNRSRLTLPFYFALQPTQRWELALQSGFQSDLAVIRDGWHVPVALLTTVSVPYGFDVGVEGGLTSALGPQNDIKQRVIFFNVAWRTGS